MAFPPFDLGWLAVVAPAPLAVRWLQAHRARAAALDGFIAGVVFFGILLTWTWHFGVVAYVPFVAVLSLYLAGAGALVAALARRGVAGPFVVGSAWILFEALRGRWPLGGFSWGEVGYAFHDIGPVRSVATWGGVLAVSFVAVCFATSVGTAVVRWRGSGRRAARRPLAVALALVLAVGVAHAARPNTTETDELRVAVLQGNDRNRPLTAEEIQGRFLPESHFGLADELSGPLDLVVLPESSLDEDPRIDPVLDEQLAELARRLDTVVLSNAAVEVDGGERLENTNFRHGPDGRLTDTYVKRHLVPFGEYVPARRHLGFIDELDQIPRDHVPGSESAIFDVSGVGMGNLICFESAFTELARAYADDGAGLLVVSTNNRSFRRSANSAQHIAIGQLRAAETGRPVVHAGISGQSAFIDPDGDVVARTGLFERTTLVRTVTATSGRTPYVAAGDWILLVAGGVLALAALRARRRDAGRPADEEGFAGVPGRS